MTNKEEIDFGELCNDDQFKERIYNFKSSLEDVKKIIDEIVGNDIYENLSRDEQVRTKGQDPNQGELKNEINRVKEYMAKSRKLYERNHVMPRLDKGAAGRFVRSGLWDPNQKTPETPENNQATKRKREESTRD